MERHFMAVCVVCLLCVDHLPCQQHINNDDLLLFSVKMHEPLMHNTHTKNNQIHNSNNNNNNNNNNNHHKRSNINQNNEEEEEEEKGENIQINKNIYYVEEEQLHARAFDENSLNQPQQQQQQRLNKLYNTNKNAYMNIYKNIFNNNKKYTATTDKSIDATIYLPNIIAEKNQKPQKEHRIKNNFLKYNNNHNDDDISIKGGINGNVDLSKTTNNNNNTNERKRLKRHANHNHNDYEREKLSTTTLLHMPKITQEYLKNIFMEYGGNYDNNNNNNNNATITLKSFQRLLQQLGLTEFLLEVQQKETLNNITTTKTMKLKENNNNNNENNTQISENNTCISETSLLKLVQKQNNKTEHQHDHVHEHHGHGHEEHQHVEKNYALNREDVLNMCPVLLYQLASPIKSIRAGCIKHEQIDNMQLEEYAEGILRSAHDKQTLTIVWIYAFISVLACSILGLVGVAIIPFMDSRYYQHIIHFLVALAVGTMTGDALLHLLPHSLTNQSETQMIYKGLVCMSGILFFYITEHGLTMISEWRKNKVKKDMKNTKWQMAKVMRDTGADSKTTKTTATTRHTTCAPIISNNVSGNIVAGTVNDKVCKSKYSSYPYCYDEIAMDMLNDVWLHLPKNLNNITTTTTAAAGSTTATTTTTAATAATTITTTATSTNDFAGSAGSAGGELSISDGDIDIGKFERRRNGKKIQNNPNNDPVEMSAVQSLLTEQQQQQNHCPHNHHHHHHHENSHNNQQQQYNNYNHYSNDLKLKVGAAQEEEKAQDAELEANIDIEASGDGLIKNYHTNNKPNGHNACNCKCKSCHYNNEKDNYDDDDDDERANNETSLAIPPHNNHVERSSSVASMHVSAAHAHARDNEPVTVILREHEATHHGHSHKHGHVHSPPETLSAVAWMIIMGDGLHNFTDGMAIGAAFAESIAGGFSTALAVFCHELPHELGDFAILMKAGMSVKSAVFYNLLTGVLSFIGMIFGIVFGQTQETAQWMFAAAAGLFIYIALVDMMPEISAAHKSIYEFILQILGISSGVALMLLIAIYEEDLMNIFPSQ